MLKCGSWKTVLGPNASPKRFAEFTFVVRTTKRIPKERDLSQKYDVVNVHGPVGSHKRVAQDFRGWDNFSQVFTVQGYPPIVMAMCRGEKSANVGCGTLAGRIACGDGAWMDEFRVVIAAVLGSMPESGGGRA
jgi:hypothetical protein